MERISKGCARSKFPNEDGLKRNSSRREGCGVRDCYPPPSVNVMEIIVIPRLSNEYNNRPRVCVGNKEKGACQSIRVCLHNQTDCNTKKIERNPVVAPPPSLGGGVGSVSAHSNFHTNFSSDRAYVYIISCAPSRSPSNR